MEVTIRSKLAGVAGMLVVVCRLRFGHFRTEIRLISRQLAGPFPALDERVPVTAEYGWVRARQRYLEGQQHLVQGDLLKAVAALEDSLRLASGPSMSDVSRDANILRGIALQRQGRWDEGDATLTSSVAASKAAGDRFREANATLNLGAGFLFRDRYDEALPFFEAVMSMTDLSSLMVYAIALRNAGVCYARLGDFDRAIAVERRSVEVNENRGPRVYLEQALGVLGAPLTCSMGRTPKRSRTCVVRLTSRLRRDSSRMPLAGPTISRLLMPRWVNGMRPSA
jgi:tetratricopeptide (TPR) repeat protein